MQIVWLLIISIHTCTPQWFALKQFVKESLDLFYLVGISVICLWRGVKFLVVLLLNNPATVSPPELWLIVCLIMIFQTKGGGMIPVISMVYVD